VVAAFVLVKDAILVLANDAAVVVNVDAVVLSTDLAPVDDAAFDLFARFARFFLA
jgi:hypothetical protein